MKKQEHKQCTRGSDRHSISSGGELNPTIQGTRECSRRQGGALVGELGGGRLVSSNSGGFDLWPDSGSSRVQYCGDLGTWAGRSRFTGTLRGLLEQNLS